MTCRFGMTWSYVRNSGWTDKDSNRTVDPSNVGSSSSKLVDVNGNMWVVNNADP